jgi:hypothetical protein
MGLKIKNNSEKITIILLTTIILLFVPRQMLFAQLAGPTEIISGAWGSGPGQFGLMHEDTADSFPEYFKIASSGKIFIGDTLNKRIQVFSSSGYFIKEFSFQNIPEYSGTLREWPLSLFVGSDQCAATQISKYTQIYNVDGVLLHNLKNVIDAGLEKVQSDCSFYTRNPSTKIYKYYSPSGQLLQTYTSRPLELGVWGEPERAYVGAKFKYRLYGSNNYVIWIKDENTCYYYNAEGGLIRSFAGQPPRLIDGNEVIKPGDPIEKGSGYRVKVKYPNKEYVIVYGTSFDNYHSDPSGNIYGINPDFVCKFDQSGTLLGRWDRPKDKVGLDPSGPEPSTLPPGIDVFKIVNEGYGPPILDVNGNIYTWMRTPTNYKILKWTWQGGQ